jgi:hypothetical protein
MSALCRQGRTIDPVIPWIRESVSAPCKDVKSFTRLLRVRPSDRSNPWCESSVSSPVPTEDGTQA